MRQIALILMVLLATMLLGCSHNGAEQLFDTAKLEELQDNRENATKLYHEIIEKYPESEYAKRAKERLSALEQDE